jgi:hypothetical protein
MRHLIGIFILSVLTLNAPASALAKGKTVSERPTAASVTITRPENNSHVKEEADAEGTCRSSVAGDVWVFVWPELAPGRGYPQSPNAGKGSPASCNKEEEQWSTPIFFGGPPQSYEIAVYVANAAASKEIATLLVSWAKVNKYPGMPLRSLPKGLVEKQRIQVTKP